MKRTKYWNDKTRMVIMVSSEIGIASYIPVWITPLEEEQKNAEAPRKGVRVSLRASCSQQEGHHLIKGDKMYGKR